MNNKRMLSLQLAFYLFYDTAYIATSERKTHWSDVDTGGYTALDFALHDSHVLNANVFMRPLGRVGIYRVLLYNLYSGTRVTYVP